jgi:hypothetical protein
MNNRPELNFVQEVAVLTESGSATHIAPPTAMGPPPANYGSLIILMICLLAGGLVFYIIRSKRKPAHEDKNNYPGPDTYDVKDLLRYSGYLRGYLIVFSIACIAVIKVIHTPGTGFSPYALTALVWLGVLLIGMEYRPTWGRYFAMLTGCVMSAFALYAFVVGKPGIGILFGLFSVPLLFLLFKSKKLFGSNRTTHKELKKAV